MLIISIQTFYLIVYVCGALEVIMLACDFDETCCCLFTQFLKLISTQQTKQLYQHCEQMVSGFLVNIFG